MRISVCIRIASTVRPGARPNIRSTDTHQLPSIATHIKLVALGYSWSCKCGKTGKQCGMFGQHTNMPHTPELEMSMRYTN